MKGTIEQVWENESRNGQKYITVQIGGERYSVWDTKYFDRLQEGAEIDYDFRQSGKFRNLTEVNPIEPQGNPDPAYRPNDREHRCWRDRQRLPQRPLSEL